MSWNPVTVLLLSASTPPVAIPFIAYTDGTNYSFAHPLLDNTGAIVSPASQGTLASVLAALQGTLAVSAGSLPLPAGASTAANQATANTTLTALLAAQSKGVGSTTAMVSPSPNGTPLGTLPAGASGARIYLPAGTGISFAVESTQPGSPPLSFAISASTTGPNWDENLAAGQMIYVTAVTGSPLFRWF